MPFDTSIGYQYSGFSDLTPVLSIYQAYPHRVYPPLRSEWITTSSDPHPRAGGLFENGVVSPSNLVRFQQAAEHVGHSVLDYEPTTEYPPFSTGTVTIDDYIVELTGPDNWPAAGNLIPGRIYVGNKRYEITWRADNKHIYISTSGVVLTTPTSFETRHMLYREHDSTRENLARVSKTHQEYAYALTQNAELAQRNGAKIGIYEFITNNWRNFLYAVHEGYDFGKFERELANVVNLKCDNGMSILDIINSFGGNVYWNAYVSNVHQQSSFLKKRYRRAMRQLAASYRNVGMLNNVPLFRSKTADGFNVADDLFEGLIEDLEKDQPGMWGMWAPPSEVTQHYRDLLTGLGYN
jgi:hypothetical protein